MVAGGGSDAGDVDVTRAQKLVNALFDADQDKRLDLTEYIALWEVFEFKGVFNDFDDDDSGTIDTSELKTMLMEKVFDSEMTRKEWESFEEHFTKVRNCYLP